MRLLAAEEAEKRAFFFQSNLRQELCLGFCDPLDWTLVLKLKHAKVRCIIVYVKAAFYSFLWSGGSHVPEDRVISATVSLAVDDFAAYLNWSCWSNRWNEVVS